MGSEPTRRAGSTRRWRRQRASLIEELRREWLRHPDRPPRCEVCGEPLDPWQPFAGGRNDLFVEIDHREARLGGPLESDRPGEDLRPLHRKCNRERHRLESTPPPPPAEQLGLFTPEAS